MQAMEHAASLPGKLDDELIQRIASGDREALAALYHLTGQAVYGYVLSILRNKHDAEDVMQDTYLKVFSAAVGYRPEGKPLVWVLVIARSLALMRLRRGKRLTALADYDPPDPAPGPAGVETRIVLREALRILSEQDRELVILHAVAGLKHREIAQVMGLSLTAALSRYHRAMRKLQKHLSEGGHGNEA